MNILHAFNPQPAPADIPIGMNNPLSYTPHPLCIRACQLLQAHLKSRTDWLPEINQGKMFGVLIVENPENKEIDFLTAYSGQIGGRSDWPGFVPAVFGYLQPQGYFKTHEAEISRINQSILQLENREGMEEARRQIKNVEDTRSQTIARYQQQMKEAKARRDARRQAGNVSPQEEEAMVKESQFMKAELRRLKKVLAQKTSLEMEYENYLADIARLKQLRRQLSDSLQQWLFSQFRMLNARGEEKDLLDIFKDTAAKIPPAGSGECCEPKLLQYAYSHGLLPLQMAMFWWGESPKEEIRHHLHFYPACNGKCKPILEWMLPQTHHGAASFCMIREEEEAERLLEVVFEDAQLAVVCKPAGLLSVPGKEKAPSVYSVMRRRLPGATGPLIVHRLDMATSGLLVIAKTDFAYRRLQQQFAAHRVQKRYVAIVCASHVQQSGTVSLPLLPHWLDRPRQIVDHQHGKESVTRYEVLGRTDATHLRLALWPLTGRTHQLRVHCAHREGLGAPILGDPLYGSEQAQRLYLHAEAITFCHPLTGQEMHFERPADF